MAKEKKQYKLSFINDGKPFTIEKWTVRKQNMVFKKMSEYEEKHSDITEEEKDRVYQDTLIKIGLSNIAKITDSDLEQMHPADKASLFAAIYYAGREGILFKEEKKSGAGNFREMEE